MQADTTGLILPLSPLIAFSGKKACVNMGGLRVLLVDDSPDFVKAASQFLATIPGIVLIGAAATGQDALTMVSDSSPDLILMDLIMPGMSGLEATRRIKSLPNAPVIIILTGHDTPEYRDAAAAAGADGFVCKLALFKELPPRIHRLAASVANRNP